MNLQLSNILLSMYNRTILFSLLILLTSFISLQSKEAVNLNLPPSPTKVNKVQLPSHKTFTLENGLKVYYIEDHKLPSVSFFLYFDYIPKINKNLSGLGEVTARLMKQGTVKRKKQEIDEELDFMGTDLNVEENLVSATSLSKYAKDTLEMVSEIVLTPSLAEEDLNKTKEDAISKIISENLNPDIIVSNIAKTLLYGNNFPYGEIATKSSINRIKRKDCIQYHNTYYRPNIAHLAVIGDINFEEAKTIIETNFSKWESKVIPVNHFKKFKNSRKTKIYIKDRSDSVQSTIRITHNVNLHPKDKNLFGAIVMNTFLGGGTFRLYQNLREEHGYTYGIYSSLRPDKLIGNFSIDFNTQNKLTNVSIKEILKEMNQIRNKKITKEELNLVKNYLNGQFSLSLENPATIALFAIKSSLYDLPVDYYKNYLENINAVTEMDVMQAARKYILPNNTNIIIVGKKKDIKLRNRQYKIIDLSKKK